MSKPVDRYLGIKSIAYAWACLPYGGNATYVQFLTYCRFALCEKYSLSMKDPIWDRYTEEELLIEFYAHEFTANPKAKQAFELALKGESDTPDSFADWAAAQEQESRVELTEKADKLADSVSFSPSELRG